MTTPTTQTTTAARRSLFTMRIGIVHVCFIPLNIIIIIIYFTHARALSLLVSSIDTITTLSLKIVDADFPSNA
jgi:hypothetical protein